MVYVNLHIVVDNNIMSLVVFVCVYCVYQQNVVTKEEIIELVNDKNVKELHARFDQRISFGTAGK